MTTIFEARDITKRYVKLEVLKNLTLDFIAGERVLLLGANGCGKSTLLRTLSGLARPDSGTCSKITQTDIGHAGHELFLYGDLSVAESIEFAKALLGQKVSTDEVLKNWSLTEHRLKRINELSRGLQARTSLARALLNNPRFIFLDEPTSALDDESVRALLADLKNRVESLQGLAVIATHDVQRLSSWCSRVVLLREGKVFADSREGGIDKVISLYREGNR